MRRKEADYIVVIEGEAGGAEALSVCAEIELAAQNSGFELHGTISAIAVALQNFLQVGEEEYVDGRIGGELLLESQISSFLAEVTGLQEFELLFVPDRARYLRSDTDC